MEYIKENQVLLDEEVCGRFIKDDEHSKAVIKFRNNIKLANSIVAKSPEPYDSAIDKEDLLQEAYCGLWEACINFKSDLGYQFSTYAVPTIKGRVYRTLRCSSSIKEPRAFKDIRSVLIKYNLALPLSENEIDMIMAEGKISRKQILEYSCFGGVISTDAPISDIDSESLSIADTVKDPTQEKQFEKLSEDDIEKAIDKVLSYVKTKHKDLIEEWMYATLSGYKITHSELSRKYNVSQPTVSRLLKQVPLFVESFKEEIRTMFGY